MTGETVTVEYPIVNYYLTPLDIENRRHGYSTYLPANREEFDRYWFISYGCKSHTQLNTVTNTNIIANTLGRSDENTSNETRSLTQVQTPAGPRVVPTSILVRSVDILLFHTIKLLLSLFNIIIIRSLHENFSRTRRLAAERKKDLISILQKVPFITDVTPVEESIPKLYPYLPHGELKHSLQNALKLVNRNIAPHNFMQKYKYRKTNLENNISNTEQISCETDGNSLKRKKTDCNNQVNLSTQLQHNNRQPSIKEKEETESLSLGSDTDNSDDHIKVSHAPVGSSTTRISSHSSSSGKIAKKKILFQNKTCPKNAEKIKPNQNKRSKVYSNKLKSK